MIKIFVRVIFLITILNGCNYGYKKTIACKEDIIGRNLQAAHLISKDTLVLFCKKASRSISNDLYSLKELKKTFEQYTLENHTEDFEGPPYSVLFYKDKDSLLFFEEIPIYGDTLFRMRQAIINNPKSYFENFIIDSTTKIDVLNQYLSFNKDIKGIDYIIIAGDKDWDFFYENKHTFTSDNNLIILYFNESVLKKIEIKHISLSLDDLENFYSF